MQEYEEKNLYTSTVWGQTCDSMDIVADNVELPKMETGDWLFFENMGDYSIAVDSKFNGFSVGTIFALVDSKTW